MTETRKTITAAQHVALLVQARMVTEKPTRGIVTIVRKDKVEQRAYAEMARHKPDRTHNRTTWQERRKNKREANQVFD